MAEGIEHIAPVIEAESLRIATRRAAREHAGGFAGLARSFELPISTLQGFVRGARPGRSTLRILRARIPPEKLILPHPLLLCVSTTVDSLPPRMRIPGRQALALALASVYEASEGALPDWLQEELRVP